VDRLDITVLDQRVHQGATDAELIGGFLDGEQQAHGLAIAGADAGRPSGSWRARLLMVGA
jgi:hypothetical protein